MNFAVMENFRYLHAQQGDDERIGGAYKFSLIIIGGRQSVMDEWTSYVTACIELHAHNKSALQAHNDKFPHLSTTPS